MRLFRRLLLLGLALLLWLLRFLRPWLLLLWQTLLLLLLLLGSRLLLLGLPLLLLGLLRFLALALFRSVGFSAVGFRSLGFGGVSFLAFGFLCRFLAALFAGIEAGERVLAEDVGIFRRLFLLPVIFLELKRLFARLVEGDDLECAGRVDGCLLYTSDAADE